MEQIKPIFNKNFLKLSIAFILIALFCYILFPFLPALIFGSILALALSSVVKSLQRTRFSEQTIINGVLFTLFGLLFIPSFIFIIRGSKIITNTFSNSAISGSLEKVKTYVLQFIDQFAPQLGLSNEEINGHLTAVIEKVFSFVIKIFSQLLSEIPSLFLFSIVLFLTTYSLLKNEKIVYSLFKKYFNLTEKNVEKVILLTQASCREVFLSNVLTGILQACLVTLGAMIFSFNELFLIFFITFIASFIPIIGAGPIALILSLYSFSTDSTTAGIGLLIISVVAGTADNIIRPYLSTFGEVKVPLVVSILAVLGGVITMGLAGLFLGPLISSLVYGVLPVLIEDYKDSENNHLDF